MDGKWYLESSYESVIERITHFECSDAPLVIEPIRIRPELAIFGCYVPSQPRPTSILSGRIFVRKLAVNRIELRAIDFQDWAAPFTQALIAYLRAQD